MFQQAFNYSSEVFSSVRVRLSFTSQESIWFFKYLLPSV